MDKTNDERAAFEAWVSQPNNWYDARHPLSAGKATAAWVAWQARATLSVRASEATAGAPEVTRCYGPFGYSYVPQTVTVTGAQPTNDESESTADCGKSLTREQIIRIADQTFEKFSGADIGDEWFISFAHSIISATHTKGSES